MPKCDFNKVATEITFRHGCSPVNLLHILRMPFSKNTSGRIQPENHLNESKLHFNRYGTIAFANSISKFLSKYY